MRAFERWHDRYIDTVKCRTDIDTSRIALKRVRRSHHDIDILSQFKPYHKYGDSYRISIRPAPLVYSCACVFAVGAFSDSQACCDTKASDRFDPEAGCAIPDTDCSISGPCTRYLQMVLI